MSFLRMPPFPIPQFGQGVILARNYLAGRGAVYLQGTLLVSASLTLAF